MFKTNNLPVNEVNNIVSMLDPIHKDTFWRKRNGRKAILDLLKEARQAGAEEVTELAKLTEREMKEFTSMGWGKELVSGVKDWHNQLLTQALQSYKEEDNG